VCESCISFMQQKTEWTDAEVSDRIVVYEEKIGMLGKRKKSGSRG
jgi:hypothetical protein